MARPALAVNGTWTNTTSGGLWSTTTNWSGGVVANGTDGIADFSTINITADDTVHLDTARTIGQLKFGDTTPSNNWILDNDGNFFDVLTLAVSSGTPTITVNNDTATISAVLAGTQGFTKSGAGTLLLNVGTFNNTFTGGVTVSAGTLALGNAGELGSTSNAVSVIAGATLDLGGQAIGANALSISGTGVGGNGALINSSAAAASYAGTVTASGPFTVGGAGNITLSGTVNGGNKVLTKVGNNTLTLSGATDNTGLAVAVNSGTVVLAKTSSGSPNPDVHAIGALGLSVNGGIAQLGGTGGDQIFDSASVTVTSGAFDTNGQSETFSTLNLQGTGIGGAGALVNSAASFSRITLTGGTTLIGNATIGVAQSAGDLQLNNAIGGNFALTKTGLGQLGLGGTNTFSGGLAVQQGTLYTFQSINNASTNGVLGNNTSVTLGSSGQTATLALGGGTSNMPFTLATGGTGAFDVPSTLNLQLSGAIGGAGALLVTDFGTLTLSGNNTFTGGVTISGGTLQVGNPGALNSSAPNSVAFSSTSFGTGILSLNGNSVTVSSLTSSAVVGTPVVQNANANGAFLTVNNLAANTFPGIVQDGPGGGSLGLTKSGVGTLTLSGNNTFTGGVSIQAGTLALGSASAPGSTANSINVSNGATLDLAGQAIGANSLVLSGTGVGGNGALINSSANAASYAGNIQCPFGNSGSATIGGIGQITLSGSVSNPSPPNVFQLTKIGSNTLILSGTADNFNLGMVVNAGTVILAKTSSISPAVHAIGQPGLVINGGLVQLGGTGDEQIFDLGSVTVNSGAFDTTGQSQTFANLSLAGAGIAGNGALLDSSRGDSLIGLTGGTTLTADTTIGVPLASATLTLNGPISGGFGITKVGAGRFITFANNTYTGTTNIAGGSFAMDGGSLTGNVLNQATFDYSGGTFSGRLTNLGTVVLGADFTAGNGMENDGVFTLTTDQTVTLNGAGLDNEGTFTMTGGTLNLIPTGNNVNRGNLNLSANLGLGAATFSNSGTFNLNGGSITGATGTLINGIGGVISGSGMIQTAFSNSGGLLTPGSGTLNVTQAFTNSGLIELNSNAANLVGGAINNTGSIRGVGTIGNAITNNGSIEPLGGILFLSGPLVNPAGGLIRASATNELVVNSGLATNAGTINLTGGTFDNNNHPLSNVATGEISGWGTFATGGTGLDNNGSITFSGGQTTVNGPVTNEGGKTITVAQNNAIFTGLVTNNATATFNTVNATATFAGGFVNNGNSNFVKAGGGIVQVDTAPTLNNGSTLSVTTGTMRFNVVSGAPSIGTGVTAVVSSGATLELAGSVSALANGSNRVNVINNSNAPGILVSGTNQQVGNIDGSGTTQVNAGSDLTANHIVQSALVIGGTSKNPGLVTIDASDASGNPLGESSGFALADSLTPSAPFGEGVNNSANLTTTATDSPAPTPITAGDSDLIGNASSVPEPSTLLLALFAVLGVVTTRLARRHFRSQTV
ncbi:MAG TPA: autotransporter-associated beta strand repeat-containing protein [Pirellulales bacterium]|nr:autotransporter-associated beta strand repeat-containing protein [Pirellulales bacterium]